MSTPLFDHPLRALRRNRAVRIGAETFLYDRAFDDCVDRLASIQREFQTVLLAGCPNPDWPQRLAGKAVTVLDPGPLMAARAGGQPGDLESLPFEPESFDLCLSIGLLDTANNLPLAAGAMNLLLRPGGLLLGAIAGGNSLPSLRRSMLAASADGQASPHVHPRVEPASLAHLLVSAGFSMPVVDVDRAELAYGSLDGLVRDLRAMGATNVLSARSRRPISRAGLASARSAFLNGRNRAAEQIEILHFAAWKSG